MERERTRGLAASQSIIIAIKAIVHKATKIKAIIKDS
jgi:hypothetical protein